MRLRLGSRHWYSWNKWGMRDRRVRQTGWTGRNTRLILVSVSLIILAIVIIYQLHIRQDADAQSFAQTNERAQQDTEVREPVWDKTPADASQGVLTDASRSIEASPLSAKLEVPLIMQLPELPTGCEAAATAMMLQYAGSPLTKLDVALQMPYSSDPSEGFVGDPFTGDGFTIYPQALMSLVRTQLGSAIDLTGTTLDDLRASLQANKPVCCWIADDRGYVHCVVVTGYEDDTVYLNDPLEGYRTMAASEFEHLWANNAYRALSY